MDIAKSLDLPARRRRAHVAAAFCTLASLALPAVPIHAETVTAEPDAFLDYIEATGTQYIDTGVNAETGLKARIDFAPGAKVAGNDDWSFLDACLGTGVADTRSRIFLCHLYNQKPFFGYGLKSRGNPENSFEFVRGQRYEIVTDVSDPGALEVYQNGAKTFGTREPTSTSHPEYGTLGSVDLQLNLFVFAGNQSGNPNWYGRGRLYELKILRKNAQTGKFDLLRHYLPCVKGGRAGLYDKVYGTISYSYGSAEFVAGPVLDKPLALVESVTSDGKQWFDTLVWGKSGLRSEVEFSTIEHDSDRSILGCRKDDGETRLFMAYHYQTAFHFAHGTLPSKANLNVVAPTNGVLSDAHNDVRYLVKTDMTLGHFSMTVSRNGGEPVEILKNGVDYGSTYLATTNTLALLTNNRSGKPTNLTKATLYRATIWDGDELLRDFVPVVATNSAGVAYAGLYDMVTKRIYKRMATGGTADFDLSTYQVGGVTNALVAVAAPTTRFEYVESDGSWDYVDLGVTAKSGIELDATAEWLVLPNERGLVAARKYISQGNYYSRLYPYSTYETTSHAFHYSNSRYTARDQANGVVPAENNVVYKVSTHLDTGDQSIMVWKRVNGEWTKLGERLTTAATAPDLGKAIDLGAPLYLFAGNEVHENNLARYPVKARVYSMKLRAKQQDGTYALVRDFVPVRDPLTGGFALWDKVSETYFRNGGKYMLAGGGAERPMVLPFVMVVR